MISTKKWLALLGLSLASFLTAIDFAIVNTALPAMQQDLAASFLQLQWIMNIYVLVVCTLLVTVGRLGDIWGRRTLLNIGVIIFGITSIMCGMVNDPLLVIIGRGLQGIGSAIIIPCSLALVTSIFKGEEQGKALGIWTSINGIGFALGPVLGGLLVHWLSWRWVFFINVPVVIPSLILCFNAISKDINHNVQKEKIDGLGFFSFTLGIASLVVAVIQGPSWGWASSTSITLFAISGISLVLLLWVENKVAYPMIKFQLFLNRTFFAGLVANFAMVTFAYVAFFFMPLYLNNIRLESANQLGLMLLPITAIMTLVSPLTGYLVDKHGARYFMLAGLGCLIISAAMQAYFDHHTSLLTVLIAFIAMGLAWGSIWGSATHTAISALPPTDSGLAAGALWTLQNLGGAIGLAITGAVFRVRADFLTGYAAVMWFLLGLSALALILIASVYRRGQHK